MALASATISMNLKDLVGDTFDGRRTKVWASTNIPTDTVIDTAGNEIRLGTGSSTVDEFGNATLTVLVPGAGSNPASWQTYVHVDYPDKARQKREQRTFGPFTITGNVNLADLILEQEIPPEYTGVLLAEMTALRDQQVELSGVDNTATAVSYVIQNDAAVKAGLFASIAEQVDPVQEGLDAVPALVAAALEAAKVQVSTAAPLQQIEQLPEGYSVLYVSEADNVVLAINPNVLVQGQNTSTLAGPTWYPTIANKGLPAGVTASAAGAAKIVKFKGKYYLQALASGVPGIYRADPVANPAEFAWSAALRTLGAGANIIGTGLACDDQYLYWISYGDPTGNRELHRFDGTTWTTINLSAHFARHAHGVFPDPYHPGHVYFTGGDANSPSYILRSTDHGAAPSVLAPAFTQQAWQCVQLSFDADFIYAAPDTTANFSLFKIDRATLTPRWAAAASHRLLPVPHGLPPRQITDLATTAGSNEVTSASAAFTTLDEGSFIRTAGQDSVPIDTYIRQRNSPTSVFITKPANYTGTGATAVLGGSAWGAMGYYGAIDPDTGIYYFATINGAAGGNVDGLFAVMPNGTVTLLGILPFSPDGTGVVLNGDYVWVRSYRLPRLTLL